MSSIQERMAAKRQQQAQMRHEKRMEDCVPQSAEPVVRPMDCVPQAAAESIVTERIDDKPPSQQTQDVVMREATAATRKVAQEAPVFHFQPFFPGDGMKGSPEDTRRDHPTDPTECFPNANFIRGVYAYAKPYVVESGDKQKGSARALKISHVAMNKTGNYAFPDAELERMLRYLANDLDEKTEDSPGGPLYHYIVEQTVSARRLRQVFEIDYRTQTPVPLETMLEHAAYLQENIMCRYYRGGGLQERSLRCIVTTHEGWAVAEDSSVRRLLKGGAHFCFPDICVDHHRGAFLCQAATKAFEARYGKKMYEHATSDTVDSSVYLGSGMRLTFCLKSSDPVCSTCEAGQSITTNPGVCKHGRGGRAYRPVAVLDANGKPSQAELDALLQSKFLTLKETCMRLPASTQITPMNSDGPNQATLNTVYETAMRERSARGGGGAKSPSLMMSGLSFEANYGTRKPEEVDIHGTLGKEIETLCTIFYCDDPRICKITRVPNFKDPSRFHYRVDFDNRYCVNKGAKHTGNRAYAMIYESGIRFHCHCTKTDMRPSKMSCAQFNQRDAVQLKRISPKFQSVLFGAAATMPKKPRKKGGKKSGIESSASSVASALNFVNCTPEERITNIIEACDVGIAQQTMRIRQIENPNGEQHGGNNHTNRAAGGEHGGDSGNQAKRRKISDMRKSKKKQQQQTN